MSETDARLRFLECMDRVNRAIQGTTELDQMTGDVLDVVLACCEADRAWLLFPCDPDAASWRPIMERTTRAYPAVLGTGDLPATEDMRRVVRRALSATVPISDGPELDALLATEPSRRHQIESMVVMAIHPKRSPPYLFGIHACAGPRTWTTLELDLVREIGHRLADALATLLLLHDLRDREARFRTFVDHATDAVFVHDADGKIVDANAEACTSLGYSREELLDSYPSAFDHDLTPEGVARINLQLAAGDVVSFVTHHHRKDGGRFPVEVRIRQFEESSRAMRISIARDITDRVRALEQVRSSNERYRELTETIEDVFWITDAAKSRMEYISPGYEKIWGRSCESLYADPRAWLATIHPDDRERVLRAAITQQPAGTYDETYRIVRSDGGVRWIRDRGFPVRGSSGEVERIVGVARDITGQREAEDELHHREERFRLLIENASDLISVVDREGSIRFQSPSSRRVLGREPDDLVGRSLFELVHPDDADAVAAVLQGTLAQAATPIRLDFRCRGPGPRWRVLQTIGQRIEWEATGCIVLNSRDITDARQLEEQFRQAQKLEAIGQLAAGVAHDFNNLLAAMTLLTDLTGIDNVPPKVRGKLDQIRATTMRGAALTRQLLQFSRRQTMMPRELDLNDAVTSIAKLLKRVLGEDVLLQLELAPRPLLACADPGMIDQVLMNLAINSRDAMPNGGRLRIETSETVVSEELARLHPDTAPGRYVCLRVHDTGTGIPPDAMDHVFEPFFTTKEPGKGTGLGLATVFGIVQQHRGWIDVYSALGVGTTFQLFFPAPLP